MSETLQSRRTTQTEIKNTHTKANDTIYIAFPWARAVRDTPNPTSLRSQNESWIRLIAPPRCCNRGSSADLRVSITDHAVVVSCL